MITPQEHLKEIVMKIERIVGGRVIGEAKLHKNGQYRCHPFGQNVEDKWFSRLEDVADFLRAHPGSGVRMTPNGSKVVKNIYIDGVPR